MKYTVKLTPHAIAEISETIAYISHVLLVPDTARAWADHLQSEMTPCRKGILKWKENRGTGSEFEKCP